LLQVIISLIFY